MKNEQSMRLVGSYLSVALDKHGYAAAELARQTGINAVTLSKIRNGREKLPLKYVQDICVMLPSLKSKGFVNAVVAQYK